MCLKRIAAFLLALLLIFTPMCMRPAYAAENPNTPIDLYEEYMEFEDDDFGYIDQNFIPRRVFITIIQQPQHYGDEVILVAILMDFKPEDNPTFEWQYSINGTNWEILENEHDQQFRFIITPTNYNWYYKVIVRI